MKRLPPEEEEEASQRTQPTQPKDPAHQKKARFLANGKNASPDAIFPFDAVSRLIHLISDRAELDRASHVHLTGLVCELLSEISSTKPISVADVLSQVSAKLPAAVANHAVLEMAKELSKRGSDAMAAMQLDSNQSKAICEYFDIPSQLGAVFASLAGYLLAELLEKANIFKRGAVTIEDVDLGLLGDAELSQYLVHRRSTSSFSSSSSSSSSAAAAPSFSSARAPPTSLPTSSTLNRENVFAPATIQAIFSKMIAGYISADAVERVHIEGDAFAFISSLVSELIHRLDISSCSNNGDILKNIFNMIPSALSFHVITEVAQANIDHRSLALGSSACLSQIGSFFNVDDERAVSIGAVAEYFVSEIFDSIFDSETRKIPSPITVEIIRKGVSSEPELSKCFGIAKDESGAAVFSFANPNAPTNLELFPISLVRFHLKQFGASISPEAHERVASLIGNALRSIAKKAQEKESLMIIIESFPPSFADVVRKTVRAAYHQNGSNLYMSCPEIYSSAAFNVDTNAQLGFAAVGEHLLVELLEVCARIAVGSERFINITVVDAALARDHELNQVLKS